MVGHADVRRWQSRQFGSVPALALGFVLGAAAFTFANPADITRVMPPARLHPAGTLLFAIFPREGKGWDEMTATAWDFAPDRAEQPLVRRCVFSKSLWMGHPLSGGGYVSLGSDLIRLQVNDIPRGYSVRLYHIDYATWNVRTVFSGRQVGGIGRAGDRVYLGTSEGSKVFDTRSGKLADAEVKRLLVGSEKCWLVELERKDGRAVAVFDPESGAVGRELKDFPRADGQVLLDPAGRHVVIMGRYWSLENGLPVAVLPFRQPRVIRQAFTLFDLERGTQRTLSARVYATGGSGRPIIPSGPEVAFTPGRLRYTSMLAKVKPRDPGAFHPQDQEWVVVDLQTQKEVSRQPYGEWAAPAGPSIVPAHLENLVRSLPGTGWGEVHDLALAALVSHDVVDAGEAGKVRFAFAVLSPEGEKLLALRGATLHYFDLKAGTHRTVPAPPALQSTSSVGACSVRVPYE